MVKIQLPDYKKIASGIKRKRVEVSEGEIDKTLNRLKRSRAKFTAKNSSAQKGDFVEIEYLLLQFGKDWKRDAFILGEGYFLPGFEEKIIGMKTGEKKDNIVLEKSGKDISVKLKIISVQNVEFPGLTDEFAKGLPRTIFQSSGLRKENTQEMVRGLGNFENLAGLKNNIKEGLKTEKEEAERQRVREEILEKISQQTKFEIPEVLVKNEQEQIMENLKRNVVEGLKISFEEYLNKIKKTKEELLESFLPQAQKKVNFFLILRGIGEREKIEVSQQEAEEEVAKFGVDPEKLKEYAKEVIRTEKTFQLLENL